MGDVFVLVIKILASLSALYMCVSPSTSLYKIHKQRDTGIASIIPLVALWACDHMWYVLKQAIVMDVCLHMRSMMWRALTLLRIIVLFRMLYGYVTGNTFPLLVTYAVGDVLNIGFIAVYFKYSKQRAYVIKATVFALFCNAVVTIYAVLGKCRALSQSLDDVTQVVGFIAVASSLLLYASPFSAISHVLKTKSSVSIPITMCLIGVMNNALWIIYGFLISDIVLIVPTCINIVLGCIQVVLFFVYHPKRRRGNAAAVSDTVLPVTSTVANGTGKDEIPFSRIATPKEGCYGDGGITSSAISIQSEVELTKITLEVPNRDQTRSALPSMPAEQRLSSSCRPFALFNFAQWVPLSQKRNSNGVNLMLFDPKRLFIHALSLALSGTLAADMSTAEIMIKVLASITSLYMCFSPAPTMHRIHEERAINSMPLLPLVSQWAYNHTWMLYGYLVQQYFPLLITYAVGSILSVVFLAVYYLNSGDQRRYVLKLVACTLLFNIATTLYTIIGSLVQPSSEAAQIIGACTVLCGFLLYASPFATVLDVVRTKNAASIPIAMVTVGAVSNAVWIVYGCFLHDPIIVVPTIVNAVFCVVQLIVYAVYHPNRRSLKAKIFRLHSRLTACDVPPNAPAASLPTESELEVSFVHLETPRYEEPRTADQLASEV